MILILMLLINLKEILDPLCHEKVLRRFIKIVENHTNITNVELYKLIRIVL